MKARSRMFHVFANGEDVWEASLRPHIAEKLNRCPQFLRIDVPEGRNPLELVLELCSAKDPRIADPDGTAGAARIGDNEWVFFGWYRPGPAPVRQERHRYSLSELVLMGSDEEDEPQSDATTEAVEGDPNSDPAGSATDD